MPFTVFTGPATFVTQTVLFPGRLNLSFLWVFFLPCFLPSLIKMMIKMMMMMMMMC